MTDLKTLDDARALLTTLKKTKSLKIVEVSDLPTLKWKDGTALDAVEISHLVSSLKGEGPGKTDANARPIAAWLDPESVDAWSNAVRAAWEKSTPAAHKWALFQQRVLASDDSLAALSSSHDWSAMASRGGSARARWYIEVFTDRPNDDAARGLYSVLVDKFKGALHASAREALERFAKARELDMATYLEEVGILGKMPDDELPFTPGETTIEAEGGDWVVHLHHGNLLFVQDGTGHRSVENPGGASDATVKKIEGWRDEVAEQSLRWGSFFLQLEDRSHTRTLAELEESVLTRPLGAQLSQNLVWRDGEGRTMRLTPDGAFDADYEELEVPKDAELSIVLLGDLDAALSAKWTQHMVDEEIVMPVDILSRNLYVGIFEELNAAADTIDDRLYGRTHEQGFHHGPPEDAGMVYTDYRTFGDYNVRVWVSHTGYSVSDGQTYSNKDNIEGMYFRDLFDQRIAPEKVHPPVLAEACIALAKMKGLPAPRLFA